MVNPRGDGAVIAAATGIIDKDDGMDEPTSVRPTGAPTPTTNFEIQFTVSNQVYSSDKMYIQVTLRIYTASGSTQ
jgi:hypothetical protein